jgi:23S rRNA (cytidine1920-2'-O)/16S rRNA (cytidine1409-2'-O)-methyltransferase
MKPRAALKRLDLLLVERGCAESPQKAVAMILAGEVHVDGQRAEKAGMPVANDARIEIVSRARKFVSRGGVKLEGALEDFAIDPSGCVCLDIGASNGGFTDCLLHHGAARVYAVDVNVEQLDWKLRQNPHVTAIEGNARELRKEELPESVDLVVIDVSFISVCKVIAPAVTVTRARADFLILIKPQFELRRQEIARGGIVEDQKLHDQAVRSVREFVESLGLDCLGVRPSHLPGAEGNQEYFLHARKKALE